MSYIGLDLIGQLSDLGVSFRATDGCSRSRYAPPVLRSPLLSTRDHPTCRLAAIPARVSESTESDVHQVDYPRPVHRAVRKKHIVLLAVAQHPWLRCHFQKLVDGHFSSLTVDRSLNSAAVHPPAVHFDLVHL